MPNTTGPCIVDEIFIGFVCKHLANLLAGMQVPYKCGRIILNQIGITLQKLKQ